MSRWSAWRSGQPSGRASEAVYAEERRSFFGMFFGSLVPGSLGNSDGISNIKPSRILYLVLRSSETSESKPTQSTYLHLPRGLTPECSDPGGLRGGWH